MTWVSIMTSDDGWTVDQFLAGRLEIKQPARGYRAGSDAVLLAAAVPASAGARVLDVGCGVGTAALCLLTRVKDIGLSGFELQVDLAEAAATNAARNGFAERCHIFAGDITDKKSFTSVGSDLDAVAAAKETYDHVMANPPYYADGRAQKSPNHIKSLAHVEQQGDLAQWISFCLARTKPKGTVTLINRAHRLAEMLAGLQKGAGDIRIIPLWPERDKPAKRVIVQATKGSAAPLSVMPGIVLHNPDGSPSDMANAIAREGRGINDVT